MLLYSHTFVRKVHPVSVARIFSPSSFPVWKLCRGRSVYFLCLTSGFLISVLFISCAEVVIKNTN